MIWKPSLSELQLFTFKKFRIMDLKGLANIRYNGRICDMAIPRQKYGDKCVAAVDPTFTHLAKICTFPSGNITHWKNEIFSFVYPLFDYDVKNDSADGKIKRKCFKDLFCHGFLGKDYVNYERIRTFFVIAVRSEGFSSKDYNINDLVSKNKERIIEFLESLSNIPYNFSEDETSGMIDECLDNFADWKFGS